MGNVTLKYLSEDKDRYGNVRRYVRIPGRRKVRIPGVPGSEKFLQAYYDAVAGKIPERKKPGQAARASFRWTCQQYFGSKTFLGRDPATRSWQRHHLEAICQKDGDKPVALLRPKHIVRMLEKLADTPAASNQRRKALRALFKWAFKNLDEVDNNPVLGVDRIAYSSSGHHSWTLEEVEQYERRHQIGTKARLGMALLLYTSWRREDAPRLGPQHIVERPGLNGAPVKRIQYRQAKNEHRSPVDMDIPLFPDLEAIIAATPSRHLTFLVTDFGRPFTANGFGNKIKDWCRQANLPHCSAHGLRKATATRLADRGATAHEIMAITGLRTLEEAERYTRAANRSKLADSAMAKY